MQSHMHKFVLFLLALITLVFSSGCALRFRTTVLRAAEVNMSSYRKVATLPFYGRDYDQVHATQLEDTLAAAIAQSSYKFQLLDRNDPAVQGAISDEIRKSISSFYSGEGASKVGQLMHADALISGEFSSQFNDSYIDKTEHTNYETGQIEYVTYTRTGELVAQGTIRVTEVATGKVRSMKILKSRSVRTLSARDQTPPNIDSRPMYPEVIEDIVNQFMKVIAPHPVAVTVELEKTTHHPDFDRAVSFAKNGTWVEAVPVFRVILEETKGGKFPENGDPETVAMTYFNLGVALQYQGNYDEALQYLNLAYKSNPKELYINQVRSCESDKRNAERLREQL